MPDNKVQAAIANWAPRFTSQGVDYNDFIAVTSRIEKWEQWLDAWVANGDMHHGLGVAAQEQGNALTAGQAFVRAALSYHFAKFVWMVDMAKYRQAADKAVQSLYAAHRVLDPTAERVEAPLDASIMVANLRRPLGSNSPPLVILLPGLDSTKEEFYNWENVFLDRGMATLSMDGPGQGETGYNTYIRADYNVAVTAMLDTIRKRDDIDQKRIGVVGVSMGGYYAPRAAAFEPRLKAVAAIGGPYNFGDCWPQLPIITRESFIHHSGAATEEQAREIASSLDLSSVLPKVSQNFLVVFGKLDRLIPWKQAEQVAAEAPHAELVMYEDGNHVCNNIPYKYRPLVADWMREQLANVG
ncbi:MAG: alpha/beta fold hydrolase [Anaerolineae bacterium]|nr:alpha/beta fold hydrolase [Anaerolineae bacterium]